MPAKKSYEYNDQDFVEMSIYTMIGAGFGAFVGFCSLPFLKPMTSAFLSNMPLLPHFVFMPTFTGPFIISCFAIACGYATYAYLTNDDYDYHNDHSNSNSRRTYTNNTYSYNYHSTNQVPSNHNSPVLGCPVPADVEPVVIYPQQRQREQQFQPYQTHATTNHSASASKETPSFDGFNSFNSGGSSFIPKQHNANNETSAHAQRVTPAFDDGFNSFNSGGSSFKPTETTANTGHSVVADRINPF